MDLESHAGVKLVWEGSYITIPIFLKVFTLFILIRCHKG